MIQAGSLARYVGGRVIRAVEGEEEVEADQCRVQVETLKDCLCFRLLDGVRLPK